MKQNSIQASDSEVHLPGYEVVRKDRDINSKNGGGVCTVCIYVRSDINFQPRADLSPSNLECLTIEIAQPRSKPFLVSTWYRPSQSSPDPFLTIINKLDAKNLELYLLNCCKWSLSYLSYKQLPFFAQVIIR